MTKTPFEIRFDLLNFAQTQLQGEYFAQMERVRAQKEFGLTVEKLPEYPTTTEIVTLAEYLKQFVDNK